MAHKNKDDIDVLLVLCVCAFVPILRLFSPFTVRPHVSRQPDIINSPTVSVAMSDPAHDMNMDLSDPDSASVHSPPSDEPESRPAKRFASQASFSPFSPAMSSSSNGSPAQARLAPVVISSGDQGFFCRLSPEQRHSFVLALEAAVGKVADVEMAKRGDLFVFPTTVAQKLTIRALDSIDSLPVVCALTRSEGEKKGIIFGVSKGASDEFILAATAKHGVSYVRSIHRGPKDALEATEAVVLTFDKACLPSKVMFDFRSYPIKPCIPRNSGA